MAEPYTPTTDEIVAGMTHLGDNLWRELTEAEVRRGLSAHDREVAARALQEAAHHRVTPEQREALRLLIEEVSNEGEQYWRGQQPLPPDWEYFTDRALDILKTGVECRDCGRIDGDCDRDVKALAAQVERVRALHERIEDDGTACDCCDEPSVASCAADGERWPCLTTQALDAAASEGSDQ